MMWSLCVRNTIFEKPNVPQRDRAGRDSRENILTCGKKSGAPRSQDDKPTKKFDKNIIRDFSCRKQSQKKGDLGLFSVLKIPYNIF